MLVYRVCTKNEVDKILTTKDFSQVGIYGIYGLNGKNNHNYNFDKLYLHFFQNKENIFLYLKDRYISTYDIPESILRRHIGIGKYPDYFNHNNLVEVFEYAIESELIHFEYLKKIEKINKVINIVDYLYDKSLNNFVEVIYESTNKKYILKR